MAGLCQHQFHDHSVPSRILALLKGSLEHHLQIRFLDNDRPDNLILSVLGLQKPQVILIVIGEVLDKNGWASGVAQLSVPAAKGSSVST